MQPNPTGGQSCDDAELGCWRSRVLMRDRRQPAGAADDRSSGCGRSRTSSAQQQQEIKQLRGELRQQKAIGTRDAAAGRARRGAGEGDREEGRPPRCPTWVNKFTRSATSASATEGFYNQPTPKGEAARRSTRATATRFRWRLGVKYAYSDELSGDHPPRERQPGRSHLDQRDARPASFSRKNVNLDWAYHHGRAGQDLRHPARAASPSTRASSRTRCSASARWSSTTTSRPRASTRRSQLLDGADRRRSTR